MTYDARRRDESAELLFPRDGTPNMRRGQAGCHTGPPHTHTTHTTTSHHHFTPPVHKMRSCQRGPLPWPLGPFGCFSSCPSPGLQISPRLGCLLPVVRQEIRPQSCEDRSATLGPTNQQPLLAQGEGRGRGSCWALPPACWVRLGKHKRQSTSMPLCFPTTGQCVSLLVPAVPSPGPQSCAAAVLCIPFHSSSLDVDEYPVQYLRQPAAAAAHEPNPGAPCAESQETRYGVHGLPDFPGYDSFRLNNTPGPAGGSVGRKGNGNVRASASQGGQTRQPDATPSAHHGGNGTVPLPRTGPVSALLSLLRVHPWKDFFHFPHSQSESRLLSDNPASSGMLMPGGQRQQQH